MAACARAAAWEEALSLWHAQEGVGGLGGVLGFRGLGVQGFKVSRFVGFRFRDLRVLGFRILGFRV